MTLKAGDFGWIIYRQAILYSDEYGLNREFEATLARICADFVQSYDRDREAAWIAEIGDQIVGSIFLMQDNDPATGKLRMLYVEPLTRGSGIGNMLVSACIERARIVGYRKLALWTASALMAARRLYACHGFIKTAEEPHNSFGKDLVGETWSLDL